MTVVSDSRRASPRVFTGTSGVVGVSVMCEPADVAISREDCLLPPVPGKISSVPGHPEIARDRARERPPTFGIPAVLQEEDLGQRSHIIDNIIVISRARLPC